MPYSFPNGANFSSESDLSAFVLSRSLCKVVSLLQGLKPYTGLTRYEDWWEHDGLQFERGQIGFDQLFGMVNSPRALLESMCGDEGVEVGVAPDDNSWYLRFYLRWDEEGYNLIGKFDITVPTKLADWFQHEVSGKLEIGLKQQEAESYFRSIAV